MPVVSDGLFHSILALTFMEIQKIYFAKVRLEYS